MKLELFVENSRKARLLHFQSRITLKVMGFQKHFLPHLLFKVRLCTNIPFRVILNFKIYTPSEAGIRPLPGRTYPHCITFGECFYNCQHLTSIGLVLKNSERNTMISDWTMRPIRFREIWSFLLSTDTAV